jgi:aspartyl-tRNA(Asn)/glutamyl-tRNA(Gln) amidotransferase subunit A
VGLKTTHGLIPLDGVVPLCPRFDTVGPLCRSVEDAAELLSVLTGTPAPDLAGARLGGARLLVLEGLGPVTEPVAEAFEAALGRIAEGGARIERADVPSAAAALPLSACITTGEAYAQWGAAIEDRPEVVFHQIRDRFLAGAAFSADEYLQAWARLDALRAEFLAQTRAYDAVLLPTTPNLPPNIARLLAEPEYYASENLLTLRNTRAGSLLGLCGLSLPTETSACGVMVLAGPGEEGRLLRLGAALEAVLA